MKDRVFIYKCRLCNSLHNGCVCSFPNVRILAILSEVILSTNGISANFGGVVSLTSIHQCTDGSIGISDLQGVRDYAP